MAFCDRIRVACFLLGFGILCAAQASSSVDVFVWPKDTPPLGVQDTLRSVHRQLASSH